MTREGDLEIPIKSGMTRYDEEGDLGRSPVRPRRTRNDLGRSSIEAGTTREGDLGRSPIEAAMTREERPGEIPDRVWINERATEGDPRGGRGTT